MNKLNNKNNHQTKNMNISSYSSYTFNKSKTRVIDELPLPQSSTSTGIVNDSIFAGQLDCYGTGGFNDDLIFDNGYLSYQQLAYYSQNPIVNSIISTPAMEMTRKWIKFVSKSDEDKNDYIKTLEQAFNRFKIKSLFYNLTKVTMLQGGCLLHVRLKDNKVPGVLQTPLLVDSATIKKGDLLGFKIIEPLYCTVGTNWNSTNPLEEDFYNPQYYNIYGQNVHLSRLLKFTYIDAPFLLKPMYRFFGIPLVQICMKYIQQLENMLNSQEDIVARLNISVLKTNLQALIYDNGSPENTRARMEIFNAIKDNNGILAIDNETEDFSQLSMNMSGVSDAIRQQAEFICAAIKAPATKFLGSSIVGGLNSNGDNDIRNYYDFTASNQENMYRDNLTTVMHIVMLNEFGEIDEDIDFEFEQLWEANELELSQIRVNETNRAVANVNAGITTSDEERDRLNHTHGSGYDNLTGEVDTDDLDDVTDLDEDELTN